MSPAARAVFCTGSLATSTELAPEHVQERPQIGGIFLKHLSPFLQVARAEAPLCSAFCPSKSIYRLVASCAGNRFSAQWERSVSRLIMGDVPARMWDTLLT